MDDKKIEDHSHAYEDFLFAQNADLRAQLAEQAALLVTVTAKYETAVRIQCQMTELQHKTETQLAAAEEDMKLLADEARKKHCDDTPCFACRFDCDMSVTQSGDFANECPGFDKDDCFEWRGPQEAGEVEHAD